MGPTHSPRLRPLLPGTADAGERGQAQQRRKVRDPSPTSAHLLPGVRSPRSGSCSAWMPGPSIATALARRRERLTLATPPAPSPPALMPATQSSECACAPGSQPLAERPGSLGHAGLGAGRREQPGAGPCVPGRRGGSAPLGFRHRHRVGRPAEARAGRVRTATPPRSLGFPGLWSIAGLPSSWKGSWRRGRSSDARRVPGDGPCGVGRLVDWTDGAR